MYNITQIWKCTWHQGTKYLFVCQVVQNETTNEGLVTGPTGNEKYVWNILSCRNLKDMENKPF
jgi:hypothetical protein